MPDDRRAIDERRELNDERDRKLRGHADPDCQICHGKGQSESYVTPGKEGSSPCTCTGFAVWQAGPCPEIPEPDHHDEPRSPIPERDEYWAQFNDDVAYIREHVEAMCRVNHGSSRLELANEALRTLATLRPADSPRPEEWELREALEPFVRGLDHRDCEDLDDEVAPYVTRLEAERARAALSDHGSVCDHKWVDMRNEDSDSGEYCWKCNVIRSDHGSEEPNA